MANLGNFEVAAREVDPENELDMFVFAGETFTVAPDPNIIALGRFARAARTGAESGDMESLATLIDTVASCVVEEDENRFLDWASKKRADPDVLLRIVGAVLAAQAARPTGPLSDSPSGPSTTGPSSRVSSSSEVLSGPAWRDTPFGRRELAVHPELYEDIEPVATNGRLALVSGA